MAAKKFYAVRKGHRVGIFESWEECKVAVEGFSGAEYKGFPNREEAEGYLEQVGIAMSKQVKNGCEAEEVEPAGAETGKPRIAGDAQPIPSHTTEAVPAAKAYHNEPTSPDTLITYVDGSYEHSLGKYAFGCVFLMPDGTIYVENGSGNNPESAKLRNVTGEMLGAMFAVRFAIKNGFKKVEIRYDYEGVEKWVTGAWKSKTELTQKYSLSMRMWQAQIEMSFTKVVAHSNVYYNEMADKLAKQGLVEKEDVPPIRTIEEMEPWKEQD